MKVKKHLSIFVVLGVVVSLFPACNGIFGSIYDEPSADDEYGFIETDPSTNSGTLYIDATSYTRWTHIDFHTQTIDTANIVLKQEPPANWDIAIHRYDVKTNGGSAIETPYEDFPQLWSAGRIPDGEFLPDQQNDSVIIDMSGMMEGKIGYTPSPVNRVIDWVTVDLSIIPPTYSSKHNVFLVRLKDETYLALKLESYANDQAAKGYITIKYIYPLKFN